MKHIKLFEDYKKNNKFYLVIDDFNKIFNNDYFLSEGKLKGLSGISSSENIYDSLGTGCDIFIEMDAASVLKNNDVQKVDYSDVNFLCYDNFKNLKRIMGKRFTLYSNAKFVEAMFQNMDVQGDLDIIKNSNIELYQYLTTNISTLPIQNINSLEEFSYLISKETNINKDEIYSVLKEYIVSLVDNYKYEEEWLVLSKTFIIPATSLFKVNMSYIDDNVDNDRLFPKVKKDIEEKISILKEKFHYSFLIIN